MRPGVGFQSLNQMNKTSIDSMHEISIQDSSSSGPRPATLALESPFGRPTESETSPDVNGVTSPKLQTPIDQLKEWSLTTYKCTKQLVNEKLGKCQRTVDMDLEADIDRLRETQNKYSLILKLTRDMSAQYHTIITQQIALYECLNELAMRETKASAGIQDAAHDSINGSTSSMNLGTDFRQNAEMLRNVAKNGEKLLLALKFFISNLTTLVHKTIEDTIITIKAYEMARLEYDAEKNSSPSLLPSGQPSGAAGSAVVSDKLLNARCKYERLRDDVIIKMKFLEENKAKVMHKQLILFHNAFAAFASGNASALDSTLKQFSIKVTQTSFLEK